jgi:phospholipase/lecithinase/hemolysin
MRGPALLFALASALLGISQAQERHPLEVHRWKALYAFGDSYSDTGAGYVDGNGPTAVAYLAERLSISFTYAGDPNSADKSLNFAVSGAQTGQSEGIRVRPAMASCGINEALLGRGMQNQVRDFTERVKARALRFDPNTTLFFLAGGLNDVSLPAATSVANLESEVRSLHEVGAQYVMVALMPTSLSPDIKAYQTLNKAIAAIPHDLQSMLPGVHILVSKWGEYYDEVFKNPRKYGITNTTDRCAGRALYGEDPTPCPKPDSYFYFHEGHPSTAVHRIVGIELSREVLQAFP